MLTLIHICHKCDRRKVGLCGIDSRKIQDHAAESSCPLGRFDGVDLADVSSTTKPAQPTAWQRVVSSWIAARSFAESMASRGIAGNRAAPAIKALRVLSCHGSDDKPPCPHRAYDAAKRFHYCGQCGCGAKEIARLDAVGSEADKPVFDEGYSKLDFPTLACPIGARGFSNFAG